MNDPGGNFPSNVHRRVLGHLSTHLDDYGWSASQLVDRMRQDASTWFEHHEQIQPVLDELEKAGDAVHHPQHGWKMTEQGFRKLTGPIQEVEHKPGPAVINPPEPKKRRLFRRTK